MGHLYVLFREMSVQVFCPFFQWVVCFDAIKCLKLFVNFGDQSPINHIIGKYSLSVCGLFFCFVYCFIAVQKLLSLSRSHLFIFAFISIILRDGLKMILL